MKRNHGVDYGPVPAHAWSFLELGSAPLAIDHFAWLSHKHGTVFLPASMHQLLYRLSRDNLKHFYLPNLTNDFKLLSHICVSCPRSYLRFIPRGKIYTTLISTFYYYYTTTTTITCTILIPMFSVFMFPLPWDSHGHSIPVHTSKYIQCLPMCTTSCEDSHNPCVNSTCIPDVMAMPARECVFVLWVIALPCTLTESAQFHIDAICIAIIACILLKATTWFASCKQGIFT